jgi:hypothetical protein
VISGSVEPPVYVAGLALAIAIAPVVIALVLVYRGRAPRLNAAALLVYWGLFIVVVEHATGA